MEEATLISYEINDSRQGPFNLSFTCLKEPPSFKHTFSEVNKLMVTMCFQTKANSSSSSMEI